MSDFLIIIDKYLLTVIKDRQKAFTEIGSGQQKPLELPFCVYDWVCVLCIIMNIFGFFIHFLADFRSFTNLLSDTKFSECLIFQRF